MYNIVHILAFN